jgi:hypothetical protein
VRSNEALEIQRLFYWRVFMAKTTGKVRRKTTAAKRISEIIAAIEGQLTKSDAVKPSVADYIRLLQMQKEFVKQKPRKIQVTWVEPKTAA